jgi:glycosyltransferase involved in cell wall biosynthesis
MARAMALLSRWRPLGRALLLLYKVLMVARGESRHSPSFDHTWRGETLFLTRLGWFSVNPPEFTRPDLGALSKPFGVNLSGFITGESGMGTAVRGHARSLQSAGVPLTLNDLDSGLRHGDASFNSFSRDNPYLVNYLHQNADMTRRFLAAFGTGYLRSHYNIAFWLWEQSLFPKPWLANLRFFHEVWVSSDFTRRALQPFSDIPIIHMPLVVDKPVPSSKGRPDFGIGQDDFVFGYFFDVSSWLERKNPHTFVRAFKRAFEGCPQAKLLLKFTNSRWNRWGIDALIEELPAGQSLVFDQYLDSPDVYALMNCLDCYVSTHRCEGFGLTVAEAMALGKPVIATDYSSTAEFLTPQNGYPLAFQEVVIEQSIGPYLKGAPWADPSEDHLVELLRHVYRNPDEAAAKAAEAARDVEAAFSIEAIGQRMAARLQAAGLMP